MPESTRIIDELNRAIDGSPWHGSPVAVILRGVTSKQAAAKPIAGAHSIWELVRHMTAWTNECARRLAGLPSANPPEGDWPKPSGTDAASWKRDCLLLFAAHRRLIKALDTFSDAAIAEPTSDPRNKKTGKGVSKYVLLHGLAQHHAYHAGQISLLKKAAGDRPQT